MNPMFLMQIKSELEAFNSQHPKLRLFFKDAIKKTDVGDIMEISLTKADGSKMRTNIRISPEDKSLLENLMGSIGSKL